jgi:hypothetical protein
MIHLSAGAVAPVGAPSLVPGEPPIDLTHLARMTLGEASLEREVLQLFGRQAEMLLARMQTAAPAVVAAAAHTLKGSARGIGAWPVASAAEAVELAAPAGGPTLCNAVTKLSARVDEAAAVIAELLRKH